MSKARTFSGILLLGGASIAGFFLLKTAFSTGNPRTDCLRQGKAWLQLPGESGRCLTHEQKEAALLVHNRAGIEAWKQAERDRLLEYQETADTALETRFSVLFDEYYRRRIPASVLQAVWCSFYQDTTGDWYRPDRAAAVLDMWGPARINQLIGGRGTLQTLQQVGLRIWPTLSRERRAAFWADVTAASAVAIDETRTLNLTEAFRITGPTGRKLEKPIWVPVLEPGATKSARRDPETGRWINATIFGGHTVILVPFDWLAMVGSWNPRAPSVPADIMETITSRRVWDSDTKAWGQAPPHPLCPEFVRAVP